MEETHEEKREINAAQGLKALSPLFLMIILFVGLSIYFHDFYKTPLIILFVVSSIFSLCLLKRKTLNDRIAVFSRCAADTNLLLMVWIFILAGAFASSAKAMGAVDATVNLTLSFVPHNMLLAGIFIATCFVSLSVGTSVGTVVALVPVAAGLAHQTGVHVPLVVAVVVGGAFFGDNLSFISDTTVVATRTQGCRMKDKFRTNFLISLPAAVLTICLYIWMGMGTFQEVTPTHFQFVKVIPYLFVLLAAVMGMNVMIVLALGILLTGIIGMACGAFDLAGWFSHISSGIADMSELIIISMLAGGLLGVVRELGGIAWILDSLTRRVRNRRGAEYSIALIVSITNCCTANNTIAILTVGDLVRDIAKKYGVDPRKSASILDTFSCCVQGCIPYGVQLLMASGLAAVSTAEIIPYLYYPFLLFFFAILAIHFHLPRFRTKPNS